MAAVESWVERDGQAVVTLQGQTRGSALHVEWVETGIETGYETCQVAAIADARRGSVISRMRGGDAREHGAEPAAVAEALDAIRTTASRASTMQWRKVGCLKFSLKACARRARGTAQTVRRPPLRQRRD